MLQISASLNGTRLVGGPRATLELSYSILDTDPFISQITGSVDWGDGIVESTGTVAQPYGPVTLIHGLGPGVYQVRIVARNFREPYPDETLFQQKVTVVAASRGVPDAPPIVFGPILPRTQGYPAPADWNFNIGRDGAILESSLTMLLLTRRGERIYDADYGTSLNQMIFGLSDQDLPNLVREEIARAVAANEPRVELIGTTTRRTEQGRQIAVQAEFRSKLSGNPLVLNLGFAA